MARFDAPTKRLLKLWSAAVAATWPRVQEDSVHLVLDSGVASASLLTARHRDSLVEITAGSLANTDAT